MAVDFETTDWRLVAGACSPSIALRRESLDRVFRSYREPIEAWLCRRGLDPERAGEFTQDFFHKVIIERELLAGATPRRGRLRTLLRKAALNHWRDAARRDGARLRAETAAAELQPEAQEMEFDAEFDHEWARILLQKAMERTRQTLIESGRAAEWQVFEQVIYLPCVHGIARPAMAEVARRSGLPSAAAASTLLFRAKDRAATMFRQLVSETVNDPEEFHEELSHVEGVLSSQSIDHM
jgi:DNA-directed RNA polymerase specialized sigma24 family protein